jgi:AraC-like DNA-binding protein
VSRPESPQPAFISRAVTQARRFYLQLNPGRERTFTVLCGGWERCAPNYEINRARFPHFAIEFVAGGEGWLELDGKRHRLRRGIAFAYGPGTPHRIRTDSAKPLSKYFVDFAGDPSLALLAEAGLDPGACRMIAEPEAAEAAFEQVIVAGLGRGRFAARIAALQTEALLLRMAEIPVAGNARQGAWRTFERCRAHIDAHFLELDSAEATARACHVDPAYLSRLFAMHGSESPYRYLMRRKMAHAAELLHEGSLIVREVADRLGMDAFQFSKAFKRVHGIAPTKFLARHGGRERNSS